MLQILLTLAAIAAPSAALSSPQTSPPDAAVLQGSTVTVVGKRLHDTQAVLQECIARHCPADEDIKATLAVAGGQFLDGDYSSARSTLLASRRRTARFAKTYPVEVARLHGAISRVGEHLGDPSMARSGKLDQISALKAGLSDDDPQVLLAQLSLGDDYVADEQFRAAVNAYDAVARHAAKLGLVDVEGAALLRSASLQVRITERGMAEWRDRAERSVATIMARKEPAFAPFVTAARALDVQLKTAGTPGKVDAAVANYRPAAPARTPQLLYVPPVGLNTTSDSADQNTFLQANTLARQPMESFDKQWIDLAFDIYPDGRVGNVRLARQSPQLDGNWSKLVIEAVQRRRYAPMTIRGTPSVARLERYTFTSELETKTGSHIRSRSVRPKLEMIDLSGTTG